MAKPLIQIEGDERWRKRMGGYRKALTGGIAASVEHVKGAASLYPPVSRRPMVFTSAKQRRGFFAKLRSGEIEVPYRRGFSSRSETMSKRWEGRVEGTKGIVENNASYASLVHDPRKQTEYHRITGWKTTEQIAQAEAPAVKEEIRQHIKSQLTGSLTGRVRDFMGKFWSGGG